MANEPRPGREVLVEVLLDEGVTHLFGNPGSTELPLVDELAAHPEIEYVHALQENSAVGMADGYALATGRPSFVNLHTMGGLGGGMSNLTNARASGTPMVVSAGQQSRAHLIEEPLLSGDLVRLAEPVSKWGHELRAADEIGRITRRAFADARTPPRGPVFISIPMDVLDEPTSTPAPSRLGDRGLGTARGLEALAARLQSVAPDDLAVVAGDRVSPGAMPHLVGIVEHLGSAVYGAAFSSVNPFPTRHPAWSGYLSVNPAEVQATLGAYRLVFVVGAPAFLLYDPGDRSALLAGIELLHLDEDPALLGRNHTTSLGLCGEIEGSLSELSARLGGLEERSDAARGRTSRAAASAASGEAVAVRVASRQLDRPLPALVAADAVARSLPRGAVVVDESVTASGLVKTLHRTDGPNEYFFCRGAALGWGMPAALGVALARPDRPVVCVVGDGAAAYSIQSLWTAAHHRIPVVFVVLNNRQYRILKASLTRRAGRSVTAGHFVAMDLDDPPPDYVSIAGGFGIQALRAEDPDSLTEMVASGLRSGLPLLIDVPIAGALSN